MNMWRSIVKFFDRLEDKIRSRLSHQPILYALIGGVGVVLFWRGVWHMADYMFLGSDPWWDGPVSLFVSTIMLLMVGLFVSEFIGDSLILSGLKKDKKLVEKTETEVETEEETLATIKSDLAELERDMEDLKKVERTHHNNI